MEQLLKALDATRWITVRSVWTERRDLHLHLELFPTSDAEASVWLVSCLGVREFSLVDFDGGGLQCWRDDHPALSQYTSPKASLRVVLSGASRAAALGVLWRAHVEAVDDWVEFDRFVPAVRLYADAADSVTLHGPRFLLEAYAAALKNANFRATLKLHKRRLYWQGGRWSERRSAPSLLHFGSSFVVAEQFVATMGGEER
jgi:hypothetical protein